MSKCQFIVWRTSGQNTQMRPDLIEMRLVELLFTVLLLAVDHSTELFSFQQDIGLEIFGHHFGFSSLLIGILTTPFTEVGKVMTFQDTSLIRNADGSVGTVSSDKSNVNTSLVAFEDRIWNFRAERILDANQGHKDHVRLANECRGAVRVHDGLALLIEVKSRRNISVGKGQSSHAPPGIQFSRLENTTPGAVCHVLGALIVRRSIYELRRASGDDNLRSSLAVQAEPATLL
mmetsp:Transcript_24867/g.58291  ORF Transcript_24867/g.58291 Transcript_24867/m.58291 type:complete len:232 (-) Transcript_24867:2051-2746(-)